jgi:hypothetical protein
MKNVALVVCLGLVVWGCGSGSMVNAAKNVAMKGGQWEYVVTPEDGGDAMIIDADVPGTSVSFSSGSALIFNPAQAAIAHSTAPLYCSDLGVDGGINGADLSGQLSWGTEPTFAKFAAVLTTDGQAISSGTYNGQSCTSPHGPGDPGPNFQGTLTGYTIAPATGTYSGTVQSSEFGNDVVTFVITQNADFTAVVAGTSVENGVTTVFGQEGTAQNNGLVTGATVVFGGTAQNVNGSQTYGFSGHLNAAATQLTITSMGVGENETVTGTLTRQ